MAKPKPNPKPKRTQLPSLPHSWSVPDWPASVWPGSTERARYIVKAHRPELLRCGAITRVGREIVVLGAGYAQFLAAQTERVESYQIPPNLTTADVAA